MPALACVVALVGDARRCSQEPVAGEPLRGVQIGPGAGSVCPPYQSLHAPQFWPLLHAVCFSLDTAQWVGRLIVEHVIPGACQEAAEPGPKSIRAYAENLSTAQWEA